jgi:hypothetical protein
VQPENSSAPCDKRCATTFTLSWKSVVYAPLGVALTGYSAKKTVANLRKPAFRLDNGWFCGRIPAASSLALSGKCGIFPTPRKALTCFEYEVNRLAEARKERERMRSWPLASAKQRQQDPGKWGLVNFV